MLVANWLQYNTKSSECLVVNWLQYKHQGVMNISS